MRQVTSSGSVKAIWLNRADLLRKLQQVAGEAQIAFPEIIEIRLFGSLARGEQTGLSDADILILTRSQEPNPLERMRPYFFFFLRAFGDRRGYDRRHPAGERRDAASHQRQSDSIEGLTAVVIGVLSQQDE